MANVKGVCAYIDILGFSEFVKEDKRGAIYLLQNYQTQLHDFITERLGNISEQYGKNSFQYLIPFSDSIFFYSEDPSLFILQLANFIHGSFHLTSDAFSNPENPIHPEEVTERGVEMENGKVVTKKYPVRWYPLLFRGGIGYGDAVVFDLNAIHKNTMVKTPFVFGESVIEAVRYENLKLKGARIICSKEFFEILSPKAKQLIHPCFDTPGYYELYWSNIMYLAYDDLNEWFVNQLLMNEFYLQQLIPAANLWIAYNHRGVAPHYYNLLKMIVRGVLIFFENTPFKDFAEQQVKNYLDQVGLQNKVDDLMK